MRKKIKRTIKTETWIVTWKITWQRHEIQGFPAKIGRRSTSLSSEQLASLPKSADQNTFLDTTSQSIVAYKAFYLAVFSGWASQKKRKASNVVRQMVRKEHIAAAPALNRQTFYNVNQRLFINFFFVALVTALQRVIAGGMVRRCRDSWQPTSFVCGLYSQLMLSKIDLHDCEVTSLYMTTLFSLDPGRNITRSTNTTWWSVLIYLWIVIALRSSKITVSLKHVKCHQIQDFFRLMTWWIFQTFWLFLHWFAFHWSSPLIGNYFFNGGTVTKAPRRRSTIERIRMACEKIKKPLNVNKD